MSSYNRVIIMGRLTRDPATKQIPNVEVCEFGIATNRKFKTANGEDREEVCFLDCTIFGKRAAVVQKYFAKGSPVLVEGHLKTEAWEDKQGGGKRSRLVLIVDDFQFVGPPAATARPDEPPLDDLVLRKPRIVTPAPAAAPIPDDAGFTADDIPF